MGLLDLLKKLRKDEKEFRIVVLGLDNAGKTTILKSLSEEEITHIKPTQGFNVKALRHEGFKLNVWDIGGQKAIRAYWPNYLANTDALVYVVDSADKRVGECNEELQNLLLNEELKSKPLLVFANKQDLISSLSAEEIVDKLNLTDIQDRRWAIYACCAITKEGLQEGMEWVVSEIQSEKEIDKEKEKEVDMDEQSPAAAIQK